MNVIRSFKSILKWLSIVSGMLVLGVLSFTFGWKSWSPDQVTVEAHAQRMDTERSFSVLPSASISPGGEFKPFLQNAIGSIRFGGPMGLGKARVYKGLQEMNADQLSAAFATAFKLPGTSSLDDTLELLLDRLIEVDPRAAVQACVGPSSFDDRMLMAEMASRALIALAELDGKAAYTAWVEQFEGVVSQPGHFRCDELFKHWGRQDFEAAFEVAIAEFQERENFAYELPLRGLLDRDDPEQRDRVLALIKEMGDDEMLEIAHDQVVRDLAWSGQHDQALAWLESQDLESQQAELLKGEIADAWLTKEPETAAAWFLEGSDDTNRASRMAKIVQGWVRVGPNDAGAWLGEMIKQYGPQADLAIAAFAGGIASKDPAASLEWLSSITDDSIRTFASEKVGEEFANGVVNNVNTILDASTLNKKDRAAITEKSKQFRW